MNSLDTCIIPAAGRGTRWEPVSTYLPKEMLPLINRPVIEWVIKEAIEAGCINIVVVINKNKEVVRNYLTKISSLPRKVKLTYVYQEKPLGISHALLLARKAILANHFSVALPDLPTIYKIPPIKQLIKTFQKFGSTKHVISLDKFPETKRHLYGKCLLSKIDKDVFKVIHFCNKDNSHLNEKSYGLRLSGRYVFSKNIFDTIEKMFKGNVLEEVNETDALSRCLSEGQQIVAAKINGKTFDTGYPEGYIKTNNEFQKLEETPFMI